MMLTGEKGGVGFHNRLELSTAAARRGEELKENTPKINITRTFKYVVKLLPPTLVELQTDDSQL